MLSECIHHVREDWALWKTFSTGKCRVNVFKANHAFEDEKIQVDPESGFQRRLGRIRITDRITGNFDSLRQHKYTLPFL